MRAIPFSQLNKGMVFTDDKIDTGKTDSMSFMCIDVIHHKANPKDKASRPYFELFAVASKAHDKDTAFVFAIQEDDLETPFFILEGEEVPYALSARYSPDNDVTKSFNTTTN